MGLNQRFAGRIEPSDPAFRKAPAALRKAGYEHAGNLVLEHLAKQLSRGIGANGRAMKARIRAVLPDGADGPVMEPHYDHSRVITLADYVATADGLTLFWQAGTGHASHRKARKQGMKAPPFGVILEFHANGEVPHAPVRDVRLCAARTTMVQRAMNEWWERHKPKPVPVPKPAATSRPTGTNFTREQQRRFTPPPLPKPLPPEHHEP